MLPMMKVGQHVYKRGAVGIGYGKKWTEMNIDDGGDTQKFAQRGAVEIA